MAKIKGLHSKAYTVTEAAVKLMIFFRGHNTPLKRLISKPQMDPFLAPDIRKSVEVLLDEYLIRVQGFAGSWPRGW